MAVREPAAWQARANSWLASHHGVISMSTLVSFGAARRTVHHHMERGRLALLMPGVLRSTHWPLGREQLMVAACARNPAALIAFTTAARLWDMRRVPRDDAVHVLVPHGCSPELPGVVVHRCRRVDPIDAVTRPDGIRLTSPPRTLFDSADILGFDAASSVLEQLVDGGYGTLATHTDTWLRLARPGRPGTRTMTAVLRSRPVWRDALQSDLEARVLAEIERQGLPEPQVQHAFRLPDGSDIRIDFAWPDRRVALEVDHPFWHAGAVQSHRDKHRDRKLISVGWMCPRITDLDVSAGLRASIADVALILARAA